MAASSSVLPGQSPPTALMCMPGRSSSPCRTVARVLSAVSVVTMSAPCTASATLAQARSSTSTSARLRISLRVAAASTSYRRRLRIPSRPTKPSAWNSLWLPLPISAITRLSGRARQRAAMTEVAAVRSAVLSVSSLRKTGAPVSTRAIAPKAITVGRPRRVLRGWPLTYLKA